MKFCITMVACLFAIGATTQPTTMPDSPLEAIAASLKSVPPSAHEAWDLGPFDDMIVPDSSVPSDNDPRDLRPAQHRKKLVRTTQIVEFRFSDYGRGSRKLDLNDVLRRWSERMSSIISPDEITLAKDALKKSRQYSIEHPNGPDAPTEEVGDRFVVRCNGGYRSIAVIDLLWADPDDPHVAHDWALFPQNHSTEKETR